VIYKTPFLCSTKLALSWIIPANSEIFIAVEASEGIKSRKKVTSGNINEEDDEEDAAACAAWFGSPAQSIASPKKITMQSV